MADKKFTMDFKAPVVMVDGNGLAINKDKSVNIVFFQVREETDTTVKADIVTGVRLNVQQLKSLKTAIDEALDSSDLK